MLDRILIFVAIVAMAAAVVGVLIFQHFYDAYQRYLRKDHPKEYNRLVLKDKILEDAPWFRWPIGSAGPMLAIFNIKQGYGDHRLVRLQRKALTWLFICVVGFILSLLLLSKFGVT